MLWNPPPYRGEVDDVVEQFNEQLYDILTMSKSPHRVGNIL